MGLGGFFSPLASVDFSGSSHGPDCAARARTDTLGREDFFRMKRLLRLWRPALLVGVAAISGLRAGTSEELRTAVALYDTRHYSAARERFEKLARSQTVDVDVDFYLGRLALWFDEEEPALAHLERAAQM